MTQKNKADGSDNTTYSWDSQNRLTGLTRTGTNSLTATFKYDMGNRRIEKTINGNTVKFIYDGDQIVGEQKSDGTTTSVLAGLAIDEMIARYSNGQQSTYLTDALGSVIAQLKDDQSVQNQYGYSPYGVTVKGNAGVVDGTVDDKGNASQYTGRENDGTGLYYYRARYYMAGCGRFISEDPIGLGGGQTNLYAYVGGDPINLRDPSGLAPGDDFCSIDAAAKDAMDFIGPKSFRQGLEYGGWIYKNWYNDKYSYDSPTRGMKDSMVLPNEPWVSDVAGWYHTHPPLPGYSGEGFSDADKKVSDERQLPGYVRTPKGKDKKYSPTNGQREKGPTTELPTIPSEPKC